VELEKRIESLEQDRNQDKESIDKALEAQRNFYKPKLKALLEDQKIQVQTETEKLKFDLSEVQAKLMDREMKLRKLEVQVQEHEKSQAKLREFYMQKLKVLEQEKRDLENVLEDEDTKAS
jgi:chromosome segregation ATPase